HRAVRPQSDRARADGLLRHLDRDRLPDPQPARQRGGVAVLLLLAGALLVAVALGVVLDAVLSPAEVRRASLRRVASYAGADESSRPAAAERPRLSETVVPALSKVALRLTPRGHRDDLALRLEASGMSSRLRPDQYLALKTLLAGVGVVAGFAI